MQDFWNYNISGTNSGINWTFVCGQASSEATNVFSHLNKCDQACQNMPKATQNGEAT